jgi:hypothetical protein
MLTHAHTQVSSEAAFNALLAHKGLVLRLLVDLPLRALQRRALGTPGLDTPSVLLAARLAYLVGRMLTYTDVC